MAIYLFHYNHSAIGKEPMGAIIRQIIPFVVWSLVVLVMVAAFPGVVTWLPNL